ncbi:MAG: kelch repeat-containing protein, partial [Chitinophagaceae bacterium]
SAGLAPGTYVSTVTASAAGYTDAALQVTLTITSTVTQWMSKANALRKRSEVNSVVYNGKLYAFLGFRDSTLNVEPTAEVYDPVSNTWTLLNSLSLNKVVTHQGVTLIDDNVWHIGGRVGRHPGPLTSEIWIYNITSNSWSPGPIIKDPATGNPLPWGGGGAAFLGRTLHVFGGF